MIFSPSWWRRKNFKLTTVVETLATYTALCIPSRSVNCSVSNIQHYGSMKFHFIFLLLFDGSSFLSLVFFQFSIFSTIDHDNAPREHLTSENKARFTLFFCLHFGHFGKGRHYFRKHTLRNLGKRLLFRFGSLNLCYLFFLQWKK